MAEHSFPLLYKKSIDSPNASMVCFRRLGIWHSVTWEEGYQRVVSLARGLTAKGIGEDDRVAVMGFNVPEMVEAFYAVQVVGAVPVAINGDIMGSSLLSYLTSARVQYAVVQDQQQVDMILELSDKLPNFRWLAYFNERAMKMYDNDNIHPVSALLREGEEWGSKQPHFFEERLRANFYTADKIALCAFSSAISHKDPRGFNFSFTSLSAVADALIDGGKITDKDEFFWFMSLNNLTGLVFCLVVPLRSGMLINCAETRETILQDIADVKPTVFFAVADSYTNLAASICACTMRSSEGWLKNFVVWCCFTSNKKASDSFLKKFIDRILKFIARVLVYSPIRDIYGLSRVRVAFATGEALPHSADDFYLKLGIRVHQCYGFVESGGCASIQEEWHWDSRNKGTCISGAEIKLADDGEILFKGDNLATSRSTKTGDVPLDLKDGWLPTGDIGFLGGKGDLFVSGRMASSSKMAGGYSFSPDQIQQTLKASYYISAAVVDGDKKDDLMVIINLHREMFGQYAHRMGLDFSSMKELIMLPEAVELIRNEIKQANGHIRAINEEGNDVSVRRFAILERNFSRKIGEVAVSGDIRRNLVLKNFAPVFSAGSKGEGICSFRDVLTGEMNECHIRDV